MACVPPLDVSEDTNNPEDVEAAERAIQFQVSTAKLKTERIKIESIFKKALS